MPWRSEVATVAKTVDVFREAVHALGERGYRHVGKSAFSGHSTRIPAETESGLFALVTALAVSCGIAVKRFIRRSVRNLTISATNQ